MSEEKPGDAVILGKKFAGETFCTIKSMDHVREEMALHAKHGTHPEAMPLSVYFANKRITDPVTQAMMTAHTKVRQATVAVFDAIFANF